MNLSTVEGKVFERRRTKGNIYQEEGDAGRSRMILVELVPTAQCLELGHEHFCISEVGP